MQIIHGHTADRFTSQKIYGLKLYTSSGLVRDLIPVRTNDGVVCMYDKVSKKFFVNGGTGEFIAGGEI